MLRMYYDAFISAKNDRSGVTMIVGAKYRSPTRWPDSAREI